MSLVWQSPAIDTPEIPTTSLKTGLGMTSFVNLVALPLRSPAYELPAFFNTGDRKGRPYKFYGNSPINRNLGAKNLVLYKSVFFVYNKQR